MYRSVLNFKETRSRLNRSKINFQKELAEALNLMRVTAPFDGNLGFGPERLPERARTARCNLICLRRSRMRLTCSLWAKWNRFALGKYGFGPGEGLYTDMNAVRRDEMTDALHSIYVDQWDWELVIRKEERNIEMLQRTVL